MINSAHKGKRGEVELCEWIKKNLGVTIERNYNQASGEKADIVLKDVLIEVKRSETLNLKYWWDQVLTAKDQKPEIFMPVVAFRQNRKKWEFLVPAWLLGDEYGDEYIRISETVFIVLYQQIEIFRFKKDA